MNRILFQCINCFFLDFNYKTIIAARRFIFYDPGNINGMTFETKRRSKSKSLNRET